MNYLIRCIQKFKKFFHKKEIDQNEVLVNQIAEGIKAHAEVFSGLYETMFQTASGRLGGKFSTFDEWCHRASNIVDSTLFSELFVSQFSNFKDWDDSKFLKNAQLILRCIFQAGVIRDSIEEITVDGNIDLYYSTLDGHIPSPGEKISIFIPCWHKEDTVLEKGILK